MRELFQAYLPHFFFLNSFLGVVLWQWIACLVIFIGAFTFSHWLSKLIFRFLSRFLSIRLSTFRPELLKMAFSPFRVFVALLLMWPILDWMELSKLAQKRLGSGVKLIFIWVCIWFLFRLVDFVSKWLERNWLEEGHSGARTILPFGARTIKALFFIVGFLLTLNQAGIDVTVLLAGLGVGSAVIAFGAQKTFENLFGGIMVVLDQPARIGDEFRLNGQVCTVEQIGIRSTKVRTIERTVIYIPNSEFSQMKIENITERDQYRLNTMISLDRTTNTKDIKETLKAFLQLLREQPIIDQNTVRVRLFALTPTSFDIEINCYVLTNQYPVFLELREHVFLSILGWLNEHNIRLALPIQKTYLETTSES